MGVLNKIKNGAVFNALVILAVGVLFCIRPIGTSGMIATIAGVVLMLLGVIDIIVYFVRRSRGFVADSLFMGILKVVLGVFVLTHTDVIMTIIVYFLSVVVIVDGISNLESSLRLKKENAAGWQVHLVMALVVIAAGIFMLFCPFKAIETVSMIIGILMIVDGVAAIITILRLKGAVKEIEEGIDLAEAKANGNVIEIDDADIE